MLMRICARITERFIRKGVLDPELTEWCAYWLQKRILTGFIVTLMALAGSIFFGVEATICFLLGLLPLRRRLSGYHTKSPYACMILSLGVVLSALLIHSILHEVTSLIFSGVSFACCLVAVVCFLGNETDPKLHLTQEEISENHKLAIRTLLLESAASCGIAMLLRSAACLSACQMGIVVVVLSAAYNKIKQNTEVSMYEKDS